MSIKILDIGQCGVDGPRMKSLWTRSLNAAVDQADTADEALDLAAKNTYDLILVNRILAADGASGLEVIRSLITSQTKAPIMLVSDKPEAQDQAVALGAIRGFGKANLRDQSTLDLVRNTASQKKA